MKLFLGTIKKSILGPTKTIQNNFNKWFFLVHWLIMMTYFFSICSFFFKWWSWTRVPMSSFHDCVAQRLAHLSDHIGASVKEIHRESKNGKQHRWGSVCSFLLGILKPWVLMRGFSTIIATSFFSVMISECQNVFLIALMGHRSEKVPKFRTKIRKSANQISVQLYFWWLEDCS